MKMVLDQMNVHRKNYHDVVGAPTLQGAECNAQVYSLYFVLLSVTKVN